MSCVIRLTDSLRINSPIYFRSDIFLMTEPCLLSIKESKKTKKLGKKRYVTKTSTVLTCDKYSVDGSCDSHHHHQQQHISLCVLRTHYWTQLLFPFPIRCLQQSLRKLHFIPISQTGRWHGVSISRGLIPKKVSLYSSQSLTQALM